MGESAPAGAATSERDVLLATKLNVPGMRPDLVPRPRLAQRLDEGGGRGLVLACAPAGYGKTVLLAEWVRRGRRPVAWLSLDAADNDPARFWRHTVAALDRVRPGISERMGPLLGPPAPPSFEPLMTAAGLATLAWIRQAGGDPAGALDVMDEAVRATPGSPPGLLNPIPARRARLLLAQGDLAAAARWTQENGLNEDDEPDYAREPGHLVLARVLLAQGQPGPALGLLDRLYAAAVAQHRTGSLIEIGALRALALAARGDADCAVDVLAEALTLACPQGYVRVFADEGAPMAALLARLIAAQRSGGAAAEVPLGCLARLQRALGAQDVAPGAGRGGVTAVPGLVDPLTSRELEVLEMLAAGRSNQAIAGQLVVTVDTVKKHVSHVLGKLGAANRTEAVTRARELGLIP